MVVKLRSLGSQCARASIRKPFIRNKRFIKLERLCFEIRIVETFVKH